MEKINNLVELATSQPEEAVRNIERSSFFNISPDSYKELKTQLDPTIESSEVPDAQEGVASYLKQSYEHTAAAKNDVGILNYIENQARYIWQQISDRPSLEKEIIDLNIKDMDSEEGLSESEKIILEDLNQQQFEMENFGITGSIETMPGQIIGGVVGIGRAATRNAEIIGAMTAAGAGIAGSIGLAIPVPGATVAGLTTGAKEGFGLGLTTAIFVDAYQNMRGSVYNELNYARDDDGNPLDLDKKTKTYISHGVATMSAIAFAAAGRVIIKNNPLLKKFISPKVAISVVRNPALRAKLYLLGYISKSAASGGGAASFAEVVKIVGEEFAKTDLSTSGLMNALDKSVSIENLERLVRAGIIGAGVAGTIATITGAPGYNKIKERFTKDKILLEKALKPKVKDDIKTYTVEEPELLPGPKSDAIFESKKALLVQDSIDNISKAVNKTKLKQYSPTEMSRAKKMMFSAIGLDSNFWLHIEDLREFADNPEKGKIIRNIIDPSATLVEGAPIPIEPHKFFDIVEKFPEFSDNVRLNPEGPNANEARNYLERLLEAKDKRLNILSSLGVDQDMSPEIQAKIDEIIKPVEDAKGVFSEYEYFNRPTFTENIENVISSAEVKEINKAQIEARIAASLSIRKNLDRKFQIIENKNLQVLDESDYQETLKKEYDNFKIVEKFKRGTTTSFKDDLTKNHERTGYSPYAIDPNSLPDNLKEVYLDDPVLKKRKVFVKGGLSLDEAASMLGAENGQQLLKILIETPSKTQFLKNRDEIKKNIKNNIKKSLKPQKDVELELAYTNLSKAHIKEMEFMKSKKWPATKKGFKRIALPLPKIEDLNRQAIEIVNKTKIRDLTVRRYIVGENRNQKAAVNHILKNEVEEAFRAKENAALNSELVKETIRVKRNLEKAEKLLKKFRRPDIQQELKDSGAIYKNAADEILDVFNLDLSKRGLSKKGSFDKFVKQQVERGNANFEIPEKFNDVRESINDYDVEQFLAIADRLENILHQAKMKNKLYRKFKEKELLQTEEAIVTKTAELLKQHPDYNPKKAEEVTFRNLSFTEKIAKILNTTGSTIDTLKTLAMTLDQNKGGGFFDQLLVEPFRKARLSSLEEIAANVKNFKKNVEAYGIKNFKKIVNTWVFVPEFKGYPTLGRSNGWVNKMELLMMQLHLGDPDGIKRVRNHVSRSGERMSVEVMQEVCNRELETKDVAFGQNAFTNVFKSYEQQMFDHHKKHTGVEPVMIKGIPFTHRGITYPGGYFPLSYQFRTDSEQIAKFIEKIKRKTKSSLFDEDNELYSNWKGYQMTKQYRYIERDNRTSRPLDYNYKNFFSMLEEAIHDLHYREIGIDKLKLMKNPIFANELKSVIGPTNYRVMLNSMIEVIGEMQERNSNYFGEQFKIFDDIFKIADKGFSIATLAASASSVVIQSASIPTMLLRMGKTGPKHFIKALTKIFNNLEHWDEIVKIAEEMNPRMKYYKDAIDDSLVRSSFDFLPMSQTFFKKWKSAGKTVTALKEGQKFVNSFLMSFMSEADRIIKIVTAYACYDQFISGDSPNYSKSKLDTMTKQEIYNRGVNYVQQISDLGTTVISKEDKSSVQKSTLMKPFTKFYVDLRSQLSTYAAQGNKIKWHLKSAKEFVKKGDYAKSGKEFYGAASDLISLVIVATTISLLEDLIRGNDTPLDDIRDIRTEEDVQEFAKKIIAYIGGSVPNVFTDTTYLARDIKYGYLFKGKSDYRSVSIPILKAFGDVATGISGLADMLDMALVGGEGTISHIEMKGMLRSASYLTGGLPVNGMYKFKKYLESEEFIDGKEYATKEIERLNENINLFIDKFKNKPEAQEFIEDLKTIQKDLPQYDQDVKIPENTKEIISLGRKWNSFDPETDEAGLYGFTQERWDEIRAIAPDLGLTDNGRVSKNTAQQEKAMSWNIKNISRELKAFDIPLSIENIYGAHKFGLENFVKINEAKGDEKLSKIIGEEEIKNPIFNKFKTVKSVKVFISKKTKEIDKD